MTKFVYIMMISALLPLGTGCALFRNPLGNWTKAETKVEQKQQKLDANQDTITEQGKNYVYATKLALQEDPSTNKYHEVEQQLNDKAVATLGTPSMEEIIKLEAMVKNLLSENEKLIIKGKKQLAEQDDVVADLQQENAQLLKEVGVAQKKLVDVGTTNAGFAQKWATLMKIVWWIIYIVIGAFIIKILAVLIPPPYNSVFGIVDFILGGFIRFIFKLAPKAMQTAKVVENSYQTTLNHVVTSIEDAKAKGLLTPETLVGFLKTNTDDNSKKLITQVKQNLGYI